MRHTHGDCMGVDNGKREGENEVSSTKEERKRKVKESERKKRKEREREQWEANIKVSRECGKWLW